MNEIDIRRQILALDKEWADYASEMEAKAIDNKERITTLLKDAGIYDEIHAIELGMQERVQEMLKRKKAAQQKREELQNALRLASALPDGAELSE